MAEVAGLGDDALAARLEAEPDLDLRLRRTAYGQLFGRFGGNHALALAAYAGGLPQAQGWIDAVGDPRTRAVTAAAFIAAIPDEAVRAQVQAAFDAGGGLDEDLVPTARDVADGAAQAAAVYADDPEQAALVAQALHAEQARVNAETAQQDEALLAELRPLIADPAVRPSAVLGSPAYARLSEAARARVRGEMEAQERGLVEDAEAEAGRREGQAEARPPAARDTTFPRNTAAGGRLIQAVALDATASGSDASAEVPAPPPTINSSGLNPDVPAPPPSEAKLPSPGPGSPGHAEPSGSGQQPTEKSSADLVVAKLRGIVDLHDEKRHLVPAKLQSKWFPMEKLDASGDDQPDIRMSPVSLPERLAPLSTRQFSNAGQAAATLGYLTQQLQPDTEWIATLLVNAKGEARIVQLQSSDHKARATLTYLDGSNWPEGFDPREWKVGGFWHYHPTESLASLAFSNADLESAVNVRSRYGSHVQIFHTARFGADSSKRFLTQILKLPLDENFQVRTTNVTRERDGSPSHEIDHIPEGSDRVLRVVRYGVYDPKTGRGEMRTGYRGAKVSEAPVTEKTLRDEAKAARTKGSVIRN